LHTKTGFLGGQFYKKFDSHKTTRQRIPCAKNIVGFFENITPFLTVFLREKLTAFCTNLTVYCDKKKGSVDNMLIGEYFGVDKVIFRVDEHKKRLIIPNLSWISVDKVWKSVKF